MGGYVEILCKKKKTKQKRKTKDKEKKGKKPENLWKIYVPDCGKIQGFDRAFTLIDEILLEEKDRHKGLLGVLVKRLICVKLPPRWMT